MKSTVQVRRIKKSHHQSAEQQKIMKKRKRIITVFTRISAASSIKFFAPQVWRLFEGGAYLKFGRHKESILLQYLKIASFDCEYSSHA